MMRLLFVAVVDVGVRVAIVVSNDATQRSIIERMHSLGKLGCA